MTESVTGGAWGVGEERHLEEELSLSLSLYVCVCVCVDQFGSSIVFEKPSGCCKVMVPEDGGQSSNVQEEDRKGMKSEVRTGVSGADQDMYLICTASLQNRYTACIRSTWQVLFHWRQ